MSKPKSKSIIIKPDGTILFVYDDRLLTILEEGDANVVRASHVEPIKFRPIGGLMELSGWQADLTPIGGPILGPFLYRSEAISKEIKWIEENYLGR